MKHTNGSAANGNTNDGEAVAEQDFLNEERLSGLRALRKTWQGRKGAAAYCRDLDKRIAKLKQVVTWA